MPLRLTLFLLVLTLSQASFSDRLKDIASVKGVRSNQLIGYGLVVGLDGTGDSTNSAPFTAQSFASMLKEFGITIPPGVSFQLKNVAAVSIQAELPAFATVGQTIDVTVSSIANAKSLRGGTLLMSPLKGIDGNIYAIAQGGIVVSGFGVDGSDGSKIKVNQLGTGSIPNGASVERSVDTGFDQGPVVFNLHRADFTTAKRVTAKINEVLGPGVAKAQDASAIAVEAPVERDARVTFLSVLENLDVSPGDEAAKVIINSRTGTIVVGQHVKVSPVAVTHGSLTVTVAQSLEVSQPGAFSAGSTVVTPKSQLDATQEAKPMFVIPQSANLEDIVRAINQVGAAPGDLMAILEAMKRAGALNAELLVI